MTLFHESTDRIALIARRVKLPRPPLIDESARVLAGTSDEEGERDRVKGKGRGAREGWLAGWPVCCARRVCAGAECVRCFQLDSHRLERRAGWHQRIKENTVWRCAEVYLHWRDG